QDDSALQTHQRESTTGVEVSLADYRQLGEQRDLLMAEFERLRHSHEQALLQRQKADQALARLDERQQSLSGRLAELGSQLDQQTGASQAASRRLTNAQQLRQSNKTALQAAQAMLEASRCARELSSQTLHRSETEVRECHGVAQELRGRSRNQDVSDALRHGLRARGGLWMDESLHAPEGLEAAVAAALRGRSADVRIPAHSNIVDLQQILHQAGEAPVALFAGSSSVPIEQVGSLATAMGLKANHPLYDVFAPVQLVDDIVEAINSDKCCVSRNGWRRETNGWLIPPSGNRTAERLKIQRKLRHAEIQSIQSEAALTQATQQFETAEQALEQQQQTWQQAHVVATESESECHASQAAVARLQEDMASVVRQQARLQSDLEETASERAHWLTQLRQATDADQQALIEAEAKLNVQNNVLRQAEQRLDQARRQQAQAEQAVALFAQAREHLLRQSERLAQEEARLQTQIETDSERLQQAEAALCKARDQQDLNQQLARAVAAVEAAHQAMNAMRSQGHALQQAQYEAERSERHCRQLLQQAIEHRQNIALEQAQDATRLQDMDAEIMQRCQLQASELLQQLETMEAIEDFESAETIMQRASDLEERLERFGPVNLLAIEEFEQTSEREVFLSTQAADLEASLSTLSDTIARIDRTTRQRFKEVFEQTNANFKQTFPQLFGGGRGELRLDSDDILTAGVEVIAQPPGKRLQDVTLLSGGEKALTAVALVFSIFKIKPAPFCVLDEVDAPLDDANVARFAEMVRELSDRVQFLAISHNKITMQKSDRLIGVSMPEPGVSKIIAVDLG
ncbi:MAG: chromosome segregation protein SMC, partial [Mariprofundus sp.]|nr:chromosome segregation protein SMC [Mariprofundus sp.]